MTEAAKRNLAIATGVCGVCGIYAWVLYFAIFAHEPAEDWLVFHTAARAFLDGDHALIWDGARFTALLNERYAAWLSSPLLLHPWVYPPSFLLLLLPFGLVGAGVGLALFLLVTYGAVLAAAARVGADWRRRLVYLFTLTLCPAVGSTAFTGQNAYLTSALFLGGFSLVERRPWIGGAVLGLLSAKPQFFLLVPVALAGARNWRALVGAVAGAGLLALAALTVFGSGDWLAWFGLATGSNGLYADWVTVGRLNGISLFACARLLGASPSVANLAQMTGIVLAGTVVFWVFRATARHELRLAAILAGAILAAPHASGQDGVLLGLAAAAFLTSALEDGLPVSDAVVASLVWISPLLNPPSLFRIGLITPAIVAWFLLRVTLAASRRQPAPPRVVGEASLAS